MPIAIRVPVKYEEKLWLPDWLVRMRAQERIKYLMSLQGPSIPMVSIDEVYNMTGGNTKVPHTVIVPAKLGDERRTALIIPSLGSLSRDEVLDLAGMIREGGYGHRSQGKRVDKSGWKRLVGNFIDHLVTIRQNRNKFKVAT